MFSRMAGNNNTCELVRGLEHMLLELYDKFYTTTGLCDTESAGISYENVTELQRL